MIIDALTYVAIAMLTAFLAYMSSDDAAKYISPVTLFWIKGIATPLNGGLIALKMFRSEVFSKWKQEKQNGKDHTNEKFISPLGGIGGS